MACGKRDRKGLGCVYAYFITSHVTWVFILWCVSLKGFSRVKEFEAAMVGREEMMRVYSAEGIFKCV